MVKEFKLSEMVISIYKRVQGGIMFLKWITLRVNNLEQSVKFYSEVLKLPIAARFETSVNKIAMMGEKGSPKIELIEENQLNELNLGEGVSIGLKVENLEEEINSLRKAGIIPTEIISPNEHIKFCFLKDPNGYTIQLFEES
ncbi:lactoylglutathione lyase [Anaerosphaera aminiphila DSM 21120]|uniref:Lactoylglutathione lyase n=2 Tax=Anaerosphaera TaxID=1273095 RepID=A0A1M5PNF4_9FIRM|nr:lactoylglutathione lyase [Anaerosphaera aminiphila DSM 21120]